MADKPNDKYKEIPDYPGPGPNHPRCYCTIYGLDKVTTAQLKAIAKEMDRMMIEPLRIADMSEYYEALEGHFKKIN